MSYFLAQMKGVKLLKTVFFGFFSFAKRLLQEGKKTVEKLETDSWISSEDSNKRASKKNSSDAQI
jgi:hypothetical protein